MRFTSITDFLDSISCDTLSSLPFCVAKSLQRGTKLARKGEWEELANWGEDEDGVAHTTLFLSVLLVITLIAKKTVHSL